MPTVWIVARIDEPLIEFLRTDGWDVMQSVGAPYSDPRYPDIAIYRIEDATMLPAFLAFCCLKIMPVLALTSDWNLAEQAMGAGADDVVVEPINSTEVSCRARKLVRNPNLAQVGKLSINLAARHVKHDGCSIHLSPLEFRILVCLVERIGYAVSFDQILDEVWGCDSRSGGTLEQVKTVVKRLRAKIEPDPGHPQYIISIRSFGYRLRSQTQWEDNS